MHPVDSPALEGPAELRLHGRGRLLHEVEEAVLEHLISGLLIRWTRYDTRGTADPLVSPKNAFFGPQNLFFNRKCIFLTKRTVFDALFVIENFSL